MTQRKPPPAGGGPVEGQLHRQFRTGGPDRWDAERAAYGGKFPLAGFQEGVRPIFEIARLDQVFRIYPDVDTALAAA